MALAVESADNSWRLPEISSRLAGTAAHGVAFTRQFGTEAILSTALDPMPSGVPQSWRSWCTDLLAAALFDAGNADPESRAASALEALSHAGVDLSVWDRNSPSSGKDPSP